MQSSQKRNFVSVGDHPKKVLRDIETVKFAIYNFIDRKEKPGEKIESPIVKAHGYEWSIWVYPRGNETDISFPGMYGSCSLSLRQQADVTAMVTWHCKGNVCPTTTSPAWTPSLTRFFLLLESAPTFVFDQRYIEAFLEEDGSLVIECDIQITAENKRVWYPKKLQYHDTWINLYQNASSETSDVAFSVGGAIYRAHKCILSLRGKKLYEIANEYDNDIPIPIHSVRKEIFKSILDGIYNVNTPDIENEEIATDFLVAADCYDCSHLKLYAESIIVDKFLNAGNAAALLIFADSHSCALLKEAATNWIVFNAKIVHNTDAWSKVRESPRLLEELHKHVTRSNNPQEKHPRSEIDRLDVTNIREELERVNLELNGSREVLVDRLKTHRQSMGN